MKSLLVFCTLSAALLLQAVLAQGALAQTAQTAPARPDPQKGAVLAQRWCASCHVVAPDQTKAVDTARSFAAIARSPDFNVEKLAFFLLDPHPVMPNMTLSRNEARDLAAYIAAQK